MTTKGLIQGGKQQPAIPVTLIRLQDQNSQQLFSDSDSEPNKPIPMITKVTAKPNPFSTTITLDVMCDQNRHVIVRMFDEEGKIVKMFGWYLVRGTNVTAINELRHISDGSFILDIVDHDGNTLFNTTITKE
jgi:hypothetical protein